MAGESEFASLPDKVRAFVALRMDPAVDEALARFIERIRRLGAEVSWVKPANFHLTLRFLGSAVDRDKLAPVARVLGTIAAETAPFTIATRAVGAFPSLARPRVLWVGLEGSELAYLAGRVEASVVGLGFQPENRPYSPHLTIGRVRDLRKFDSTRRALETSAGEYFGASRIESLTLYRSVLAPSGSTYESLAHFALDGNDT